MAGLKIAAFAGIAPKKGPNLLQDNEAQIAENTKLYSGELRAWNSPGPLGYDMDLIPGAKTIYKLAKPDGSPGWLSWDTDVNVVPSPIYNSAYNPIYYTGQGGPKKANSNDAYDYLFRPYAPGFWLDMGVAAPTAAPTATVTAVGTGSTETRTYVFTFESEFGDLVEEGPPSPASIPVTLNTNGTVLISGLPYGPGGSTNVRRRNIYRSVSGTNQTVFRYIGSVSFPWTDFTDLGSSIYPGGRVLDSELNEPPPSDMVGLVSMANGILAGFRGNEIFFSKAYMPHAWPTIYALSVEFPIVGIAPFGSSLLVATTGNPFIISGTDPGSMTQEKLPLYEPCISKRSIAGDEGSVVYASPNGLVRVAQGFAGVATRNLFSRAEWQKFYPSTMVGAVFDGRYYGFYTKPDGDKDGIILDKNDQASPLTTTSFSTDALYVEPSSAGLYILDVATNKVKLWDSNELGFLPYSWKSKLFILPRPLNFAAAQIDAAFDDTAIQDAYYAQIAQIEAANQVIWAANSNLKSTVSETGPLNSGPLLESVMTPVPSLDINTRYVLMTVWANGVKIIETTVTNSLPFRMPSGFRAERWEVQLQGNVPLRQVKFAESGKGLEAV